MKEITSTIKKSDTCLTLIDHLKMEVRKQKVKEEQLDLRVQRSQMKFLDLSEALAQCTDEQASISEGMDFMTGDAKDDMLTRLKYSKYRSEGIERRMTPFTPDAMALPKFQLHLITSQRIATEEFVVRLQERLDELSGKKGKVPRDNRKSEKGRTRKAA